MLTGLLKLKIQKYQNYFICASSFLEVRHLALNQK